MLPPSLSCSSISFTVTQSRQPVPDSNFCLLTFLLLSASFAPAEVWVPLNSSPRVRSAPALPLLHYFPNLGPHSAILAPVARLPTSLSILTLICSDVPFSSPSSVSIPSLYLYPPLLASIHSGDHYQFLSDYVKKGWFSFPKSYFN